MRIQPNPSRVDTGVYHGVDYGDDRTAQGAHRSEALRSDFSGVYFLNAFRASFTSCAAIRAHPRRDPAHGMEQLEQIRL